MALPIKLIAAIATTTAAASAAYVVVTSRKAEPLQETTSNAANRPANVPAASVPTEGPDELTLCVGPDRILRVPPGFAKECPQGQQELLLAWDSDNRLCELCDPLKEPPPSEPKSDNAAVEDVERRIRNLEQTSYFEVVSQKTGKPIFQVGPRGTRIFNESGGAVAWIGATESGGHFTARSLMTGAQASIAAAGSGAAVLIGDEHNNDRIELGTRDGPFGLRFPSAKGLIAGVGQSRAGSGALIVGDLQGSTHGSFTVTDGRGMLSVTKAGQGGAAFAEATIGGGLLDIANAAGASAVKMGHNGHRYGIVLAGPVPGFPYVPRSGLPGSYFMGCASGERPACTPWVP